MYNAWGSDDNVFVSVENGKTVKVRPPVSKGSSISTSSAKEIRDYILRNEFGYTDKDIEEFNIQHPNDLLIQHTPTKPTNPKNISNWKLKAAEYNNKWATDDLVKKWKVGSDGFIEIRLEPSWASFVTTFQKNRSARNAVQASYYFIPDSELARNFSTDLEGILTTSGITRIKHLNNLMLLINGSGQARGQMHHALRFLTNELGYSKNPFLAIAMAATTSYKSDVPSFGSEQVAQSKIAEALGMVNHNLHLTSIKSPLVKIDSQEAASINFWASTLYDEVNAADRATERRWIERMLSMSENEKKYLKEGDIFSIADPTRNSVRGEFPSESKLKEAEINFEKEIEQRTALDSIGTEQNIGMKGDHRQSEYFQRKDDAYTTYGYDRTKKPRGTNTGYYEKFKPAEPKTYSVFNNVKVDGASAGPTLVMEGYKWIEFNRRMAIITAYLSKKRQLCKDPLKWYQKKVEFSAGGRIRQEAGNEAKQI